MASTLAVKRSFKVEHNGEPFLLVCTVSCLLKFSSPLLLYGQWTWTEEVVEHLKQLQREGHMNCGYGKHVVNRIQFALDNHMGEVEGKHFLVVGSERPWIEAMLLLAGASHVTSLDYQVA